MACQSAVNSTETYTYDDNGAQSSVTENGVTTPYAYDFEGKLVSVGDSTSSTRSSYVYDGDGNRLSAIVTTGAVAKTTRYLNDTNTAYVQVVEERDENGTLLVRYDNGDMDLQKQYVRHPQNGTYLTRWYLGDGLESTRQLVDASGVVTDSYGYDAFGSILQRAGETPNSRLFNAQNLEDNGLYFLRARYYNSGNGRFLNHDPLLGNSDDPVTLHRYLYANGDPINGTDPTGMFTMSDVKVTMGIKMGLAGAAYGAYSSWRTGGDGKDMAWAALTNGVLWGVGGATIGVAKTAFWTTKTGMAVLGLTTSLSFSNAIRYAGSGYYDLAVAEVGFGMAPWALRVARARMSAPIERNAANLVNPTEAHHIIRGNSTGGGHMWPEHPGKSPFPWFWSEKKILHYVSDVATDPRSVYDAARSTGAPGSLHTNAGNPSRHVYEGVREGVTIRVVVEPAGRGIVTAFAPGYKNPSWVSPGAYGPSLPQETYDEGD